MGETPMVTVRKRISYKLGHPYGTCRERRPSGLSHFDIYTKKQCMQQCLIDKIETKCECSSILFPKHRNISKQLPPCSYSSQAGCASKLIKMFAYKSCQCQPECHREKFEIVSHQYGSLSLKDHRKLMPEVDSNDTVLSVDLFQVSSTASTWIEQFILAFNFYLILVERLD